MVLYSYQLDKQIRNCQANKIYGTTGIVPSND